MSLFDSLVVWLAMEVAAPPPPPPPTQYPFPLSGCGVVFDGFLAGFDVVANWGWQAAACPSAAP